MTWSLPVLLDNLHRSIEEDLRRARETLGHPTDKGDASELVWIDLFNKYLPKRYHACKAHVVDSAGNFSQQIDVVIHDRQYSPLVFTFKDSLIIPAESVYAVFEAKQDLTAEHVSYAHSKVASVRRLTRTSLPVPTIDGVRAGKEPPWILGGIVTLSCSWSPPLGETLIRHLQKAGALERIDIGCVADAGMFLHSGDGRFDLATQSRATTRFLLELLAKLQEAGTAPMLDIRAYAQHIPTR